MDFLTVFAITAPVCVAAIVIAKIVRESSDFRLKLLKKDFADLEKYCGELESDLKSMQNKLNGAQRGPKVEGAPSELKEILPDILKEFAPMAPKWLQPMLGNDRFQQWAMEWYEKDPEKATNYFMKFLGKKGSKEEKSESAPVDAI